MKSSEQKRALACAVKAAQAVGALMRKNLARGKRVNFSSQHDIKLELDVRSQRLIVQQLRAAFPDVAVLGEEGCSGDPHAEARWVVDPIDGTVNFAFGIPHACVSIALQTRGPKPDGEYATVAGVVYDPFVGELWTAIRGAPARLNGKIIHVSQRGKLADCIVATGFAKSEESLEKNLPYFNKLVRRVRKVRMTGVAALALTYVAMGRFDAYVETGIWLWDIAAGGLIVECAGGEFWHEQITGAKNYRMIASNGRLRKKLLSVQPGFMKPGA
jgi:myo-inositol-1(or 4)-monophosphatase